jgi:hypothetical protein
VKSHVVKRGQDEERLVLKGAQERIRAEARERREQLREAQRLQALKSGELSNATRDFSWRFPWDL